MNNLPIFWSFRRCPYAMRARLAVKSAGIEVELREILLRDKPEAFLAVSETVLGPVWVWLGTGERPGLLTICGGVIVVVSLTVYIRLLLKTESS